MPVIDHFGILAPYYDRVLRSRSHEKLLSLAELPVSGTILDAGGGTGRVAQALLGMASSLVIADLSMEMLRQASKKNGLGTVCSHTEYLPFADEFFERVIMVDALHHVCSHKETAQELWRVLKPGGRIVIEEPDINAFSVKLVALAEKLALMRSKFIPPLEIVALFKHSNARLHVESERPNVWILVDKL